MDNNKFKSLTNDTLFGSFLKSVQAQENILKGQTVETKVAFFQKLVNILTKIIDIPPVLLVTNKNYFKIEKKVGKKIVLQNDITIMCETDQQRGKIYFAKPRLLPDKSVFQFRQLSGIVYHELRHFEQYFTALNYMARNNYLIANDAKKNVFFADQLILDKAKSRLFFKEREKFALVMKEILFDDVATEEALPYKDQKGERDAYNFTRDAYIILNRDGNIYPKEPDDVNWNSTAFQKVNYGDPSNYVDPDAGAFSKRINLSKREGLEVISTKIKL